MGFSRESHLIALARYPVMVRRTLHKLLASICFLLLLVTCLGWLVSYWFAWTLQRSANPDFKARLVGARLELRLEEFHNLRPAVDWSVSREIPNAGDLHWNWWHLDRWSGPPGTSGWIFNCCGLETAHYHNNRSGGLNYSGDIHKIYVPFVYLLIGFAVVFALSIRSLRNLPSILPGRCNACGYDLRATPSRCPECGQSAQFKKIIDSSPESDLI
jgi:hypothetical protein